MSNGIMKDPDSNFWMLSGNSFDAAVAELERLSKDGVEKTTRAKAKHFLSLLATRKYPPVFTIVEFLNLYGR